MSSDDDQVGDAPQPQDTDLAWKSGSSGKRSNDPYDPRNVRQTVSGAGVVAVAYLMFWLVRDTVPVLTVARASPEPGPDVLLAIYAAMGAGLVWLSVEIVRFQRAWACLIVMLLMAYCGIYDFYAVLQGQLNKLWLYVDVGFAALSFVAFKGARQIKAGKVVDERPSAARGGRPLSGPGRLALTALTLGVACVIAVFSAPQSTVTQATSPTSSPAQISADHLASAALPDEVTSACLFAPLGRLAGPLAGATLGDLISALSQPAATIRWEKSADGLILRQTIQDQLTGNTISNAISLVPLDPSQVARDVAALEGHCGPAALFINRIVLDGEELSASAVFQVSLNTLAPVLDQKRAAPTGATEPALVPSEFASPDPSDLNYEGKGEGLLSLTLRPKGPGRYAFSVGTSADECGGEVSGVAEERGDEIIGASAEDPTCKIHIKREGGGLSLQEENCGVMHGAACAFVGAVHLVQRGDGTVK